MVEITHQDNNYDDFDGTIGFQPSAGLLSDVVFPEMTGVRIDVQEDGQWRTVYLMASPNPDHRWLKHWFDRVVYLRIMYAIRSYYVCVAGPFFPYPPYSAP